MKRFVSIGECMVEVAPAAGAGLYQLGFAGDTCNTAWYARRLLGPEWQVDYVTAVGTDAVSDRLVAFLEEAGIGTAHIVRDPRRGVGLYLIHLDAGERSFSYWRTDSAATRLCDAPDAVAAAVDGAAAVYVSGITLAVLGEAGRRNLVSVLGAARQAGARIVLDPNLRPALWSDDAAMRQSVMEAAALADIALPSFDDERAVFGDVDPAATAERYADAGVPLVVVKDAGREIVALTSGAVSRHPPVAIERIVDSTAAGDSFNAGFLAAHLGGADLDRAIGLGARTAARVIGHRGALVDLT